MKNKFCYIFILIALLIQNHNLDAQWAFMHTEADSLVQIGINYIYNVQFDSANAIFNEVIKKFPEHPVGYFMGAMVEWWKIRLFRETEKFDQFFLDKIDKTIKVCEKRLDSNQVDIIALFFLGGSYGYRGRFYAIREKYWNVAEDGHKGYQILKKCWELAPGNRDIQLGTGIYNYFVVAFAEEYPIIKPLLTFFPKGDKKIGILQLKSSAVYGRYTKYEAEDVLLQIYYQFEKNYYEALNIAQKLHTLFPDNPYFHRYLARCYTSTGYFFSDITENTWREILQHCINKKTGYDRLTAREALYYIGLSLMRKGDYKKSLEYFYKCDEACRYIDKNGPSGFMIQTNLNIGKIYDLQKRRDLAIKQYKKILRMPDDNGSHNFAKKYLEKPYGN